MARVRSEAEKTGSYASRDAPPVEGIRVNGLTKRFGLVQALGGVDLEVAYVSGQVQVGRLGLLVDSARCWLPISLWLFRAAVDRARRSGTLAQY